jgi:hypothetical protein
MSACSANAQIPWTPNCGVTHTQKSPGIGGVGAGPTVTQGAGSRVGRKICKHCMTFWVFIIVGVVAIMLLVD